MAYTRSVVPFNLEGEVILEPSGRRWPKRTVLIATVLVTLAIGCLPFVSPAVAAYACPSCYGLQRVTGSLFVDPAMSVEDRTRLQEVVALAAVQVADFYGSLTGSRPFLRARRKSATVSWEEKEQGQIRTGRPSSGFHPADLIKQSWLMSSLTWSSTHGSGSLDS